MISIAFSTIINRETRRFLRIWQQTLLPPIINIALYFLVFGALVGKKIGDMGGVNYTSFIAPGLIMMAVITNSYSNVASSFFSAKFQYHIEEMLVAPVSKMEIILGYMLGGMLRGIMVGSLVMMVALFFSEIYFHNVALLLLALFLSSFLFSAAGFINGLFASKFDDIAFLPAFIITPLIYVGGVFFSIDSLSPFWQTVSQFNPMLYITNLFRYCLLGKSDIDPTVAVLFLILSSTILFAIALKLMQSGKRLRI